MNLVVFVAFLGILVVCVSAQQSDDKLDFHLIPPGNKNKLLSERSPKSIPLNYEYQYQLPSASSDEYRKPPRPVKPHKPSKPSKPSGPSGSNGSGVDIGDVVDVIQNIVGESKKAFQKR